jgi:hypothetical protein
VPVLLSVTVGILGSFTAIVIAHLTLDLHAQIGIIVLIGLAADAALGQAVMHTLAEVARRMCCFVFGIDHFGKAVRTGTRGTSAKEGRAVVLATLGDKFQWIWAH